MQRISDVTAPVDQPQGNLLLDDFTAQPFYAGIILSGGLEHFEEFVSTRVVQQHQAC